MGYDLGAAASNQQTNPPINTWFCVEFHAKESTTGFGAYDVQINGSYLSDVTATGVTTTYANLDKIYYGVVFQSSTGWPNVTCVVDDAQIADARIGPIVKPLAQLVQIKTS